MNPHDPYRAERRLAVEGWRQANEQYVAGLALQSAPSEIGPVPPPPIFGQDDAGDPGIDEWHEPFSPRPYNAAAGQRSGSGMRLLVGLLLALSPFGIMALVISRKHSLPAGSQAVIGVVCLAMLIGGVVTLAWGFGTKNRQS